MVKIEIIHNSESNLTTSSQDCCLIQRIQHLVNNAAIVSSPFDNKNSNKKNRIQTLAEACAATSIQAFWRGKYQQIQKYFTQKEDRPFRRPHTPSIATKERFERLASITIQRLWRRKKIHTQKYRPLVIKSMQNKESIPDTAIQLKMSESTIPRDNDYKDGDRYFSIQSPVASELSSETTRIIRYPLGTNSRCTRKEVIMKARDISSSKRKEISLQGIDIAHIFKDMDLVSSKEYEGTQKSIAKIGREEGGGGIYYTIPLIGPLFAFQKQLASAWIIFTQKAHISQTMALKKAAKLKVDLIAKRMRSHIFNMVDLQEESLSFLINNPGVMEYSKNCIKGFLKTAGLHNMNATKGNLQRTLSSYLKELESHTQSAFLRGRIQTMAEIVHFMSQWEGAGGYIVSNNKDNDNFLERNIEDHRFEISHLRRELETKNKCIADLSHESETLKKSVEKENIQCSDGIQSGKRTCGNLISELFCLPLHLSLLLIYS